MDEDSRKPPKEAEEIEIAPAGFLNKINFYLKVSDAGEILRRYFVMNAFDGTLTMLGIVLGSFLAGARSEKIILGAGISASFAIGISGFVGGFLTERAEREKEVKELEKAMLINLEGTLIEEATKATIIIAALASGVSPVLAALTASIPFMLSMIGIISFITAVYTSLLVIASMLFSLGAMLGRISGESQIRYGLIMLTTGLLVGLLSVMLVH